MLIVVEGLDGAGKRTLAQGLREGFEKTGRSVSTLAFPRYGNSVQADIAAEALRGLHGDVAESVYAMALLFAFDRAGALDELAALRARSDVVILDRYVASNAAYSAARLHQHADGEVVDWVYRLEYGRLDLPRPDWQLLLDVSPEMAGERARQREQQDPGRDRDAYERDAGLQHRTGAVYRDLAAAHWGGRWLTVGADSRAGDIVTALLSAPE